MNYKTINGFIKKQKGEKLSNLFKINTNLNDLECKKIVPPFDNLFNKQKDFLREKRYETAEEVVKACVDVLEAGEFVYPVIKRIIDNSISLCQTEINKHALAKVLTVFTKTQNEIKFYSVNVLSQLYFDLKKFELLKNLLMISENTRVGKKDFYVFNLFKGTLLLIEDRFLESFKLLSIAFKSKKLKKQCALPFFISSLLNGKIPKTTTLENNKCSHLVKLSQNIKFGLFRQVEYDIEALSPTLINNNLYRPCVTYLPIITVTNLIKRLFTMFSEDSKLEINKITETTGLDYPKVFSLLASAIELELIKGYISVNRDVIVFSKTSPFTDTPICN